MVTALLPPSSGSTGTSLGQQDKGSDPAPVPEGLVTRTPTLSQLPQRAWRVPVSLQPLHHGGGLVGSKQEDENLKAVSVLVLSRSCTKILGTGGAYLEPTKA